MKKIYSEILKALYYILLGVLLTLLYICLCHFCSPGAGFVNLLRPAPEFYTITAYCSCSKCCGKFADGITACGHKIKPGDMFIAAPKEIPFYSLALIPEYSNSYVPVLDRGGSIKGRKIDVFFPTHQEALNWGVKELTVTFILKGNKNETAKKEKGHNIQTNRVLAL